MSDAGSSGLPEPWLRGTLTDVDAVRRQVLHALELTEEDVSRWCAGLSDAEMNARPFGVASVAFHLRHIAGSLDRLLTYAEGRALSDVQMDALRGEMDEGASAELVLAAMRMGLSEARRRVMMISPGSYEEPRGVGRARLPSTVGGLLVHCAEHTQRHVGQAITTAKVVVGMREG
jgi:DinB superfamily